MSLGVDNPKRPFSVLMHDTLNDISTILSIAQFCLISREMSPELQLDIKRIVETGQNMSDKLKQLAQVLQEED